MHKSTFFVLTFLAAVCAQSANLLALTGNNKIYSFTNAAAAVPTATNTLTGLNAGETLLSIATFPTNIGTYVYGITTSNRFVYINTNTNAVTVINTLNGCTPGSNSNPTLNMDFDPTTGNLFILTLLVTSTNLYRVNPYTGACTALPTTTLASGQTPKPAGLAFVFGNNNSPFVTESLNNNLDSVNINSGVLGVVGSLGLQSLSGVGGFAYNYANSQAIATLYNTTSTQSNIYGINLSTGAATPTGTLAVATNLLGLTSLDGGSFPSGIVGSGNQQPPGFTSTTTTSNNNNNNGNTNTYTGTGFGTRGSASTVAVAASVVAAAIALTL